MKRVKKVDRVEWNKVAGSDRSYYDNKYTLFYDSINENLIGRIKLWSKVLSILSYPISIPYCVIRVGTDNLESGWFKLSFEDKIYHIGEAHSKTHYSKLVDMGVIDR